jgi:hypothetical protein
MDIQSRKRTLFNDLKNPLAFLSDHAMHTNGPPDSARVFGNAVFFYVDKKEWSILTPHSTIIHSNVNTFKTKTHVLALQTPAEWNTTMTKQLKQATRLVYEQQLLPKACSMFDTFDGFWTHCRKPPFLTIEAPAFSRRGQHKQFINMYHQHTEVTGVAALERNGSVSVAIRWSLSESEESGEFGWRPHFSAGIRIHKFGGTPFPIRKPWSWENLQGLSVPLYDAFIVKTPALLVTNKKDNIIYIQMDKKTDFVAAIQALHTMNGAKPWDGRICIVGNKKTSPGCTIVASILPQKEGQDIHWYTHKMSVCTLAAKRKRTEENN